jgi:hypothetical protein
MNGQIEFRTDLEEQEMCEKYVDGISLIPTVKTYGHVVAYSLRIFVARAGVRTQ